MTPEAQRIAIAEACGIIGPFDDRWIKEYEKEGGNAYGFTGFENGELVFVPAYVTDLNAMHEAEKVLNHTDRYQFGKALCSLLTIDTDGGLDVVDIYYACHATAAQRAEAFLRTIGKWEASK